MVEKKKSVVIRQAFERYAQNTSRLEDIANFLAENNIVTSSGKHLTKDQVKRSLLTIHWPNDGAPLADKFRTDYYEAIVSISK